MKKSCISLFFRTFQHFFNLYLTMLMKTNHYYRFFAHYGLNMTVAALLLGGLFFPRHSAAQHIQASRYHYSTEEGLSSNAISDIQQDDFGFIWIATWNGLSRFDGFNFYNYPMGRMSGIPLLHNRISDLCIDMKQNVWMRMYDGRIFVLNRHTDLIENAFKSVTGYENFKSSSQMLVTTSGDVIAIVDDIGLYRMQLQDNKVSLRLVTMGKLKAKTIVEGYGGDLWIGTDQGIHRLTPESESLDHEGVFEEEEIISSFSNGYNIFAGTQSGKLVTFAYGQEPHIIAQTNEPVSSVFVDSHQQLWYTNNGQGIIRMDLQSGTTKEFKQYVPVPEYDVHGARVSEVAGVVWVRMNHGGFGYYNRETDEMEFFHNNPNNPWDLSNTVAAFLALPEGVIWESTSMKGLEKLEILKNTIGRHKLVDETFDMGLTQAFSQLSTENDIRAICYDKKRQRLLMGNKKSLLSITQLTPDGSLSASRINLTCDNQNIPLGRIYGINADSKGNYWIAAKGSGLIKMTPQGGGFHFTRYCHNSEDAWSLSSDNAYCSVEDKQGNIWIGTYGGGVNLLTQLNGRNVFVNSGNAMHSYPRKAFNKVRSLAVDKEDNVWVGTTDGLLLMKYKDRKVEITNLYDHTKDGYHINSSDIVCIAISPQGEVWVGTNGGGLCHCLGKDQESGLWMFETFGSKDGLPSEEIKSITFDQQGQVWFSTEHTICSFEPKRKVFSFFSIQDGVDNTICSECAATTLPDNRMLFGTVNGFYTVDKKKLASNTGSMLKLRITDFFMDDELMTPRMNRYFDSYIPESKRVVLPNDYGSFSVRFASLNYQLQHRVHYQYKLEGHDENWINAGKDRMATYDNLNAGTYQLHIRAFLLESPGKYDERIIEIVVPHTFLLSSDAIWLYMFLLIALGIIVMLWRQRRIAAKTREEAHQEMTDSTSV